jgi:pyruvate kinase
VHTTVVVGGELSNNKGINKQGGGLTAPALTAKDMEDIKTAMALKADYVAVSFPKNATDMEWRASCANVACPTGHKPGLIAKIERAEAIPELENILRASDGIMVARGDLAVEVGNAAVPALQKRMIRMAREMDKVVITATQMMESMIVARAHPRRGQRRGQRRARRHRRRDAQRRDRRRQVPAGDGEQMAAICLEAEAADDPAGADFRQRPSPASTSPSPWARCSPRTTWAAKAIRGADRVGLHRAVDEPAQACACRSTRSPRRLASQRRMALYRNVRPLLMDTSADRDTALQQAEAHLKKRGMLKPGDTYAITVRRAHGHARAAPTC